MINYSLSVSFASIITLVFSALESSPDFVCYQTKLKSCKAPKACLYANPNNCSSFIKCNNNEQAYVKPCAPDGTEWNDNKKECDWPKDSTCRDKITSTEEPLLVTRSKLIVIPSPEHIVFECPQKDIEETACIGPKDCLYPHPKDCYKFIHCEVNADDRTGRPTVKYCPGHLEWNDRLKICDWPFKANCRKRKITTTEESISEPIYTPA